MTDSPKTMRYVAGLLFSVDRRMLVMVRKNRPEWQAGKLNAVGGKIEPGEGVYEAMEREFREETGVTIDRHLWTPVAILRGDNFEVYFHAAFSDEAFNCRTMEDEEIVLEAVVNCVQQGPAYWNHKNMIPNLRVIIPLALDETGIVKPVQLEDRIRNPETGSPHDSRPVAA